ncbi:beta-mannanase [Opitutaceae bacterium TAV1]|nr:beta-mannanase [Opitutaceae bacterium TAV1]
MRTAASPSPPGLLLLLLAIGLLAASPGICTPVAWTWTAEEANLIGQTRLAREFPDGTGRSVVTGFVQPGDALDFSVRVPAAGHYLLELTYACDADKRIPVFVDGNLQGSRLFPQTDGFGTHPFGRVILPAGASTLRIGTDWGYADIASIRLSPATPPAAFQLAGMPVNPRASPEARALHALLVREFGRRTFAGQHDSGPQDMARIGHIARLTRNAAPAILGLDLLYYSGAWNHPEGDGAVEKALQWSRDRGGIVTLSWHWLSPLGAAEPVWSSFSTGKTTFDVGRLADETSAEYFAAIRDIDRIAEKLRVLRDARMPVLWRPLHEAEGGWFWWGARGPEAAKRLYRLMYDRFTRLHDLDNLLWVWTSTDDPGAPDWYPGDDVVDIIATDLYAPAGTRGDFFTVFDRLRELYGGRKPLALGECGALPIVGTQAPWLWFLVWDDYITRTDANPAATVARTWALPRVITLERLGALPDRPSIAGEKH